MSDIWLNKINWSDDGLVQVVTQEADSKAVLMVAWSFTADIAWLVQRRHLPAAAR